MIKILTIGLFSFISILNTTFLYAAKIQSIVVVGEIRTNEDYIKSLLSFEVGDEYLEEFVAESVKRIYKTDLFMDVKVKFLLGKFEIEVVESPMINNIYFEGNKNIKQESLEKELIISKRVPFSKNKITLDVQRIIELYKRQGFLLVKVDVKMMKNEYNSVDIIFEVDEGKKSTIKYIEFMGNKFFSSYKLKKTILTTENRWWKFFGSNDTYDSERIAYDGEVLKNYYLEQGYPSFNVLSVNSEILRDESGFKVTYNIDEGVRYKYGSITFDVKVDRLKDYIDVMQKAITIKKGMWFKQSEFIYNGDVLVNELNKKGFLFIKVIPVPTFNQYTNNVDIKYVIQDEQRLFINKIIIAGNTRTIEKVLRREMRLVEGDSYDEQKINRTKNRIYSTGYFSSVDVSNVPSEEKDKVNVIIRVEEQSTGSISAGGGYSTLNGFTLEGAYSETNLFGTGKSLSVSAMLSQDSNNYQIVLGEPALFDRNLYGQVALFRTDNDNQEESSYSSTSQGMRMAFSYPLSEHIYQSVSYELSQRRLYDFDGTQSYYMTLEEGLRTSSIITHTINFNYKDNNYYPLAGYGITFTTSVAGIFGEIAYFKNELFAEYYYNIKEGIVFSLTGNLGVVEGLNGQTVSIYDRFTLGGSMLRGFDWAGVGPRDISTGDSLGGKYLYRGTAQIDFPIPGVDNYGLLFHVFSDVGNVTGLDFTSENVVNYLAVRMSLGFGIAWRSPFGNISLDWAWPVVKYPYDVPRVFLINIGTRV